MHQKWFEQYSYLCVSESPFSVAFMPLSWSSGPSYSHLLASPHTIVCVGLLVVILVSVQSAHSLKQNKILHWYVPCELESLQLLSSALKLFYGILFSFSHCCDLSSRRQYYTGKKERQYAFTVITIFSDIYRYCEQSKKTLLKVANFSCLS